MALNAALCRLPKRKQGQEGDGDQPVCPIGHTHPEENLAGLHHGLGQTNASEQVAKTLVGAERVGQGINGEIH